MSASTATVTGTPASIARRASARGGRRAGGPHPATTGSAAGRVRPAPTVSRRRSTRSGRSVSMPLASVADRAARSRRHRGTRATAPATDAASSGSVSRAAITVSTPAPTRRSGMGSGTRPKALRHLRPTASARATDRGAASCRRRTRNALRRSWVRREEAGGPESPCSASRTTAPDAAAAASAVTVPVRRGAPSTARPAHRGRARRRCRASRPGSGRGTRRRWGRCC